MLIAHKGLPAGHTLHVKIPNMFCEVYGKMTKTLNLLQYHSFHELTAKLWVTTHRRFSA